MGIRQVLPFIDNKQDPYQMTASTGSEHQNATLRLRYNIDLIRSLNSKNKKTNKPTNTSLG